jgi:epoxyqueuosine reductase QueG
MISITDLEKTALARLNDAEWLVKGQRFDSAIYLCGYCLEVAFKVRLCKDANRADFPETSPEFKLHDLKNWQTHSLKELSELCHLDRIFKKKYKREFFTIRRIWSVEMRYKLSYLQKEDAEDFLAAIKTFLKVVL